MVKPGCGFQEILNLVFPVACYGVTNEIPPLKKGVRGILKFMFPLNTPQLAAGIFIGLYP